MIDDDTHPKIWAAIWCLFIVLVVVVTSIGILAILLQLSM